MGDPNQLIQLIGLPLALFVLLGSYYFSWSVLVFPLWALLVSIWILFDNLSPASPHLTDRP